MSVNGAFTAATVSRDHTNADILGIMLTPTESATNRFTGHVFVNLAFQCRLICS